MKKRILLLVIFTAKQTWMEEMLQNWDEETQQLVFMGDLIDRGPDNKRSILTGMKYAEREKCMVFDGKS